MAGRYLCSRRYSDFCRLEAQLKREFLGFNFPRQGLLNFLDVISKSFRPEVEYRTRANKGRSRLVATPLTFQAKTHFYVFFYVVI